MRKVIEAFINEDAKSAQPVDKFDTDLSYDGKTFYFKGKKIDANNVEEVLYYIKFKGIINRWRLSKEDKDNLFGVIWKAVPNKCHITMFGNRGVVTRGIKNGNKIFVKDYKGEDNSYNGDWYLKSNLEDTVIFSENEAPSDIKYLDISNDIGKKHNFKKVISVIDGGKKLEYEDDMVVVYQNGKVIYKGIEDDEPMKKSDWKWDGKNKYYIFKEYVKVVRKV